MFRFRFRKTADTPFIASEPTPAALLEASEAVTWCFYKQLSDRPFRSIELDPSILLEDPEFPHDRDSIAKWIEDKRDRYRRAIKWINQARSQCLEAAEVQVFNAADAMSKSRLLIYEPLETVDDGAADAASKGFYDLHDAPPWDTWFLYADQAIFCCVPEFAIPRAQDGIDANPVDCIHWADWSKLGRVEQ